MPIYEYLCDACEHKMEALQKVGDQLLKDCPKCGEAGLRKLISAAAFRLKGGGWYETDFKGDQDQQRNLSKSDHKPGHELGDKPANKDGEKEKKKDTSTSDSSKSDSKSSDAKNQSPPGEKTANQAGD